MDVRRIIMDRMAELGITQTHLAELTGITRPRINAWLRGNRGYNAETLLRILEALDLEIRPARRRKGR